MLDFAVLHDRLRQGDHAFARDAHVHHAVAIVLIGAGELGLAAATLAFIEDFVKVHVLDALFDFVQAHTAGVHSTDERTGAGSGDVVNRYMLLLQSAQYADMCQTA